VKERVLKIIKQHSRLSIPIEQVSEESHFQNDLKLDSLDTTEVKI
jgi:acyl carrier protein